MAARDGSEWPTHRNKAKIQQAEKYRVKRLKKLGKIVPEKPSADDLR